MSSGCQTARSACEPFPCRAMAPHVFVDVHGVTVINREAAVHASLEDKTPQQANKPANTPTQANTHVAQKQSSVGLPLPFNYTFFVSIESDLTLCKLFIRNSPKY